MESFLAFPCAHFYTFITHSHFTCAQIHGYRHYCRLPSLLQATVTTAGYRHYCWLPSLLQATVTTAGNGLPSLLQAMAAITTAGYRHYCRLCKFSKRTKLLTRKPDLCANWFKGRESCTSISFTSSPGLALNKRQDMGQDG